VDEPVPALRTFGRTRSRTLKPGPPRGWRSCCRKWPRRRTVRPRSAAAAHAEVWLEIGFGAGEHLCGQAARRPDVLFLGAEPFVNGVANALGHIERLALGTCASTPATACADGGPAGGEHRSAVLLFPDPWPKLRHHKRRLVTAEFVAEAARVLRRGARLRFATDWADYADWALRRFVASPEFVWTAKCAADWRAPPADHLTRAMSARAWATVRRCGSISRGRDGASDATRLDFRAPLGQEGGHEVSRPVQDLHPFRRRRRRGVVPTGEIHRIRRPDGGDGGGAAMSGSRRWRG